MSPPDASRRGISIVCVYNDADVRRSCLDSSIEKYHGDLDVDFIAVDNRAHAFASAGAALNHGARSARHDLVAFVHQDVYLHSIDRLAEAGLVFADGAWGLLGANGVTHQGENVGRMRDRAQVIGVHRDTPIDADTVDEVLFLVPRVLVVEQPLSEEPELAWHAYAVEYALRLRGLGRRVGALDLGITHNSLTVNLDRLDVAHRRVGEMYPAAVPIHTTCGVIGAPRARWRDSGLVRRHGWRLRWLRHSLLAARVQRRVDLPVVISDIRHEVDLLSFSSASPLHVFNRDGAGGFAEFGGEPVHLSRYGRPVIMSAERSLSAIIAQVRELPRTSPILIVGLGLGDLDQVTQQAGLDRGWTVGIHPDQMWVLGGTPGGDLPKEWNRAQAVPLRLSVSLRP